LELFSLEEKVTLLPGDLFVYSERDLHKGTFSEDGLMRTNPFVVLSEPKIYAFFGQ
jgi:hypothetical protein